MNWHAPAENFVDAERIYRALDAALHAGDLYSAAVERFASSAPADFDQAAFEYLIGEDFLRIPTELQNDIERFRHFEVEGERHRRALQAVYQRFRQAQLELRRAEADLEKGFFKSKSRRWQQESRRDSLRQKLANVDFERRRLEGEVDRGGGLMQRLLDQIYRDPTLREARWFGNRPVLVTHHGHFLGDYLADLNHAHFRGRTLAEIIEIGPSLA